MKPTDLINFRQVSTFLSGNPENVRKKTLRLKYEKPVHDLIQIIEEWMKKQNPSD